MTTVELDRYRTTVLLREGSPVELRAVRPDDMDRLLDLFYRLGPQSVYLRFHHALTRMSREEAERYARVDYDNTFALVAVRGSDKEQKVIAVARYARTPRRDVAEVAFVVENAYQRKGLGTHLLEQLAAIARGKQIRTFQADVLAENQTMMDVFFKSGFRISKQLQEGIFRVTLDIADSPEVGKLAAERESVATVASLKALLTPASIAVVGASRREGSIGNKLFKNILQSDFTGVVYPVNPNAGVVASVKAYPTVLDIPGDVDMAVIVVPAPLVNDVAEQCAHKGVRGLVIISAGFAETGPEGKQRQDRLLETSRSHGMRLVGPNCMGVINTAATTSLNATFSPVFPPPGKVGFCTQSGALGLAILEYARGLNMGISTFVSVGNRADVSSNDLLEYWGEDPNTSVILLYLESFGNPRKFVRIARSLSASKPVIAVKAGRTAAGTRAAASHTGALATTQVGVEALSRQAGVIRVDTLEELFDVATLLSHQPVPAGRRLAIVTNGGGPGILTADACASEGLDVPVLSANTSSTLQRLLPPGSGVGNPVDMTAEATAEHYQQTLEVLLGEPDLNIVIVIFIPPILTRTEAVARAIREIAPQYREHGKTLVASFMGARGASINLGSAQEGYVPSFIFPETTAVALASACKYGDWLRKPKGNIPQLPGINSRRAREVLDQAGLRSRTHPFWLDPLSIYALMECYGIPMAEARTATTPDSAAQVASSVGYPVALKVLSSSITHKTEVGGVVLDLQSDQAVQSAFQQIERRLAAGGREKEMEGALVQKMVTGGVEVIVGMTQDPSFGPLMMFGMGGVYAELFQDVAFRLHPLTDVDAQDMVGSVKTSRVLEGWRGAGPSDVPALQDLLLRTSAMVEDLEQLVELDLNPVKVLERGHGCVVVDARVMIS